MSSDAMKRYDELVTEINDNRSKMNKQTDLLRQLSSQKAENESVKREFEILKPDGVIWKLVGPIMVKQDREDAKANVEKRIEYIDADINKAEEAIKSLEETFEVKRTELMKIQEAAQAQAKAVKA